VAKWVYGRYKSRRGDIVMPAGRPPKKKKPGLSEEQKAGIAGIDEARKSWKDPATGWYLPGNKFWECRSKHGRNHIYQPDELEAECLRYFEWVEANPLLEQRVFCHQGEVTRVDVPKMRAMTLAGLQLHLGISHDAWLDYRVHSDFSVIVARVEQAIRDQKFTGAAADMLNANIIARDLGLADKTELTGKDGGTIKTEVAMSPTDAYLKMLNGK